MLGDVSEYYSGEKTYTAEQLLQGFEDVGTLIANQPGRKNACIIVAAGDFPEMSFHRQEGDLVIAADAGLKHLQSIDMEPDLVLGDFDSVEPEQLSHIRALRAKDPTKVKSLSVEKDDTDTMAALKIGLERGYDLFFLYGFLGGRRLDHTLANLQALRFLKNHGATGYIAEGEAGAMLLHNEAIMLALPKDFHLSLLCISDEAKGVTIRGLKYEMENGALSSDYPLGVSNASKGTAALISVEEGDILLLTAHVKHDEMMRRKRT